MTDFDDDIDRSDSDSAEADYEREREADEEHAEERTEDTGRYEGGYRIFRATAPTAKTLERTDEVYERGRIRYYDRRSRHLHFVRPNNRRRV
jgi:hypothetical protein